MDTYLDWGATNVVSTALNLARIVRQASLYRTPDMTTGERESGLLRLGSDGGRPLFFLHKRKPKGREHVCEPAF
jgi:hypothetical protein